MATRSVATVFGGSGFIGRYIVKRLAHKGFVVRVAVRDTERALFLKPMGAVGQVVPLHASLTNEADGASRGGRGRPRRQHGGHPGRAAVRRLPAHPRRGRRAGGAPCRRAPGSRGWCTSRRSAPIRTPPAAMPRARAWARRMLREAFPGATILRPSLVFGPGGPRCSTASPRMARLLPVMPVICGDTRFQPVYVGDVADAVMAALARPDAAGRGLRTGRPARLAVPRTARLHPEGDRTAAADGRYTDGAGARCRRGSWNCCPASR